MDVLQWFKIFSVLWLRLICWHWEGIEVLEKAEVAYDVKVIVLWSDGYLILQLFFRIFKSAVPLSHTDFKQVFHEQSHASFMASIPEGVLINHGRYAFSYHPLRYLLTAKGEQLIKHREHFFMKTVRDIDDEVFKHLKEEQLDFLTILRISQLLNISQHYIQEL